MKRARLPGMGWLGVTLGLFVACSGKVQSLGETAGIGGKGAQYLSGGTGNVATGGATAGPATGGYTAGPASGGAYSGTGGGFQGYGGTAYQGGTTGVGGLAERPGGYAYVVEPTLPIDPNCTCTSPTQICNAARECVPRCDTLGFCAMWLTSRAVRDLYVEGSTLYFATSAVVDPLGNVGTNGALYRAEYPNGTPTLIADGLADPVKILGRYNGAAFIETATTAQNRNVLRITDAGVTTKLTSCDRDTASVRGKWFACINGGTKLEAVNLDGDLAPQTLVDVAVTGEPSMWNCRVLDDYIWFQRYSTEAVVQACYLTLSNLALGPSCPLPDAMNYEVYATGGNQLFGRAKSTETYGTKSYDISGQKLLTLLPETTKINRAIYAQSWLYSPLVATYNFAQVVRYPTTVGRQSQAVLPGDVATPAFYSYDSAASAEAGSYGFAVGSTGIFWFQAVQDKSKGQYIFHAPLPAQPCDAELPCADTAQVCTNGLCTAP